MTPHFILPSRSELRRHGGFSMVELLVGLTIGLIAMMAIYQVLGSSEGYRRTAAKIGVAQESGAIANYLLERDLRQAGYGLHGVLWYLTSATAATNGPAIMANVYACQAAMRDNTNATDNTITLSPVTITQGGVDGAGNPLPDTLTILYGNARAFPFPPYLDPPALNPNQTTVNAGTTTFPVNSGLIFAAGDVVAIINGQVTPAVCEIGQVSASDGTSFTLSTNASGFSRPTTASYPVNSDPALSALVANLGPAPSQFRYSITTAPEDYSLTARQPRLTVTDGFFPDRSGDVADGIVSLQAQYVFSDGSMRDAITGTQSLYQVRAIRLGLVSRSDQFEKEAVTASPLVVFPATATSDGVSLPLTGDATHYRYRVYVAVVPLRNRAWNP